jgi:ABC-type transport system involved in multi-copper enzyme maturation permease subunit
MNGVVFAETARRHFTSAGYLTFLLFVGIIGVFVASFNTPGSMWPSLITMLSIITGSAIIGPEFSAGTLQLIVSKPVSRPAYVLGRAGGVFAAVAVAALVALSAETIMRVISGTPLPWQRLLEIMAGELTVGLLAIALLTLLGSITVSYFNAAIYIGVQAAISILEAIVGAMRLHSGFITAHPEIAQVLVTIDDTFFPAAPAELTARWLAQTGGLIAVALALACLAFQRREVPYGAD